MAKKNISDLFALENYAQFDAIRPLKWCNAAMLHACNYHRQIFEKPIEYDELIAAMLRFSLPAVISLVYGAARAADSHIDVYRFSQIYKEDNLKQYIDVTIEGVMAYLPDPEIQDSGLNLDESYPDTQAETQKKTASRSSTGRSGTGSRNPSSSSTTKNSSKPRKKP